MLPVSAKPCETGGGFDEEESPQCVVAIARHTIKEMGSSAIELILLSFIIAFLLV
jgi:hypothetical protein